MVCTYVDTERNAEHLARVERSRCAEGLPLNQLRDVPVQLDIEKPSVLSTLVFKKDKSYSFPPDDDFIEIDVNAIGLNNKVR